jgi:hypothetical protein
MIEPNLLMRSGAAISVIGHVGVLTLGLIFAGANPFDPVPAEAIMVDIVSPGEIGEAAGAPVPPPEATPAFETLTPAVPLPAAAAPPPPPPQPLPQPTPRPDPQPSSRQAAVQPHPIEPVRPPPAPPQPQAAEEPNIADMFGLPLALPDGSLGGGFDAPAIDRAKISENDTAMFRDHLKTCLNLPRSVAPADKIRIVLRVAFKPDGTLAAAPTLIEGSASAKGPALTESVITGLQACQPYAMLPANRYKEWKVLDLSFTPKDFAGG